MFGIHYREAMQVINMKVPKILYHQTKKYNLPSIRTKGLLPAKDDFLDDMDDIPTRSAGINLVSNTSSIPFGFEKGIDVMLKIDVSKLDSKKLKLFGVDDEQNMWYRYMDVIPIKYITIDNKTPHNLIQSKKIMKKSKLREIIKEEIQKIFEHLGAPIPPAKRGYQDLIKSFGNVTTKQDLGVKKFERDVEPHLMRKIEGIKAILGQLKPGSPEYSKVKNILDAAEHESVMPTDRQMDLISALYLKSLREQGSGMSGMEFTGMLQKYGMKKPDWSIPAPNDEHKWDKKWRRK